MPCIGLMSIGNAGRHSSIPQTIHLSSRRWRICPAYRSPHGLRISLPVSIALNPVHPTRLITFVWPMH